jgi:hypothetical protein
MNQNCADFPHPIRLVRFYGVSCLFIFVGADSLRLAVVFFRRQNGFGFQRKSVRLFGSSKWVQDQQLRPSDTPSRLSVLSSLAAAQTIESHSRFAGLRDRTARCHSGVDAAW